MIFKKLISLALLATAMLQVVYGTPASARGHHGYHQHARAGHGSHHRSNVTYGGGYYTNVDGRSVHRPVFTSRAPDGASARCGDGSYSFSLHRRGTCSHHGGVARWL